MDFGNCSPHETVVHQFDDLVASNVGSVHDMVVYFIEVGPHYYCPLVNIDMCGKEKIGRSTQFC